MLSARIQLAILPLAALAWIVLAECALRLGGRKFDGTFYVADAELGWSLRPNAAGWQTKEGSEFVRINADGFRDRDRAVPKPPRTYRIAVLGNSWTEALQVPLEKTFCSLAEQALSSRCSLPGVDRVEVLNFGVSGYSTTQQLLQLRSRVWKYQPDVVLLAFYTARDVLNNVRQFNSAATPEQSPYFSLGPNGLVLDASYRSAIRAGRVQRLSRQIRLAMEEHFRTYHAINELVRLAKIHKARLEQDRRGRRAGAVTLENVIYSEPSSADFRSAWNITEAVLSEMRSEVAAHNATFWIVTLANRAQVEPDAARRAGFMRTLGVPDLDYADRRIHNFGAREGVVVTSLAAPLRAYAEQNRTYLNGFENTSPGEGHWNDAGHRAAAEVIVNEFCRMVSTGRGGAHIASRSRY